MNAEPTLESSLEEIGALEDEFSAIHKIKEGKKLDLIKRYGWEQISDPFIGILYYSKGDEIESDIDELIYKIGIHGK